MARISMRNVQKSSVSEYFDLYLSSAAARGVKDKTLQTYKNHFRSIAKRMDVTVPMNRLNSQDLENMILSMREEGLSASSINSYTRTLKVFFSWCNEEGHTNLNIKLYKAPETVKEVYTDEELLILLSVQQIFLVLRTLLNVLHFGVDSRLAAFSALDICIPELGMVQNRLRSILHDGIFYEHSFQIEAVSKCFVQPLELFLIVLILLLIVDSIVHVQFSHHSATKGMLFSFA